MKRIEELFARKSSGVLNVSFTAGYPALDSTIPIMEGIQSGGADLIEIGMPYSDPLADGPVIQESSGGALDNGMSIDFLFQQLADFRKSIQIPVVLMGYMNPVLQYGFERFCQNAAAIGIDGLILPDLPVYEFENQYGEILKKYNLDFIFLALCCKVQAFGGDLMIKPKCIFVILFSFFQTGGFSICNHEDLFVGIFSSAQNVHSQF